MSSQVEYWVWLKEDGTIVLHTENDGYAFLRNGPQEKNEEITLEELRDRASRDTRFRKELEDLEKEIAEAGSIEEAGRRQEAARREAQRAYNQSQKKSAK